MLVQIQPHPPSFMVLCKDGLLAQLAEQLTLNQKVPGSTPGRPTKFRVRSSLGQGKPPPALGGDLGSNPSP